MASEKIVCLMFWHICGISIWHVSHNVHHIIIRLIYILDQWWLSSGPWAESDVLVLVIQPMESLSLDDTARMPDHAMCQVGSQLDPAYRDKPALRVHPWLNPVPWITPVD